MICFFDDNAACGDHSDKRMPFIATVYVGAANTPKAVVIADALWCGACKPEPEPVPMPEIF